MAAANLALRFLLELAGIAAIATWGWVVGGGGVTGLALAAGGAIGFVVAWGTVVAPRARNGIPQRVRVLLGSGILLGAAALLAAAGQLALGLVFGVVNVVNTAGLLVLGGPEEMVHGGRAADPPRRE